MRRRCGPVNRLIVVGSDLAGCIFGNQPDDTIARVGATGPVGCKNMQLSISRPASTGSPASRVFCEKWVFFLSDDRQSRHRFRFQSCRIKLRFGQASSRRIDYSARPSHQIFLLDTRCRVVFNSRPWKPWACHNPPSAATDGSRVCSGHPFTTDPTSTIWARRDIASALSCRSCPSYFWP